MLTLGAIDESPGMSAPVYLDYTQSELDRAFDQAQWAPNLKTLVAKWAETSRAVRESSSGMQMRSYGTGSNENLEIFPTKAKNAPVYVFIHGGEWKRRDNLGSAFPALSLVPRGFNFVNLNFEAVPNVTIPDMVSQVRRALLWVHQNAREFGANPEAIHLFGHSSGAHLAAVLATTRWDHFKGPADILKSVTCISGLYDLEPVLLSMRRAWVKLTPDDARQLSPIHQARRVSAPITLIYGQNESPEFKRQAHAFHDEMLIADKRCELIEVPDQNHFEVLDALHQSRSALLDALVAQAG